MPAETTLGDDSSSILVDIFLSRIASTKPISNTFSPRTFIQMMTRGVSGEVLSSVIKHIPKIIVIGTFDIDSTNFAKLIRRKRLSGSDTELLNDLTKLWAELREFFEWDNKMLNDWIGQQLPILDGGAPSEFMVSQEGRAVIRKQLNAMRCGEFT